MTHHELKTWPVYFKEILYGNKTFEFRHNDRDFKEGDTVTLLEWEWDGDTGYTGNEITKRIGYVLPVLSATLVYPGGYVIFSLLEV